MWQVFRKKRSSSSVKPLNEKEIQKKLYGHYHKEVSSIQVLEEETPRKFTGPAAPSAAKLEEKTAPFDFPKLPENSVAKSHVLANSFSRPQSVDSKKRIEQSRINLVSWFRSLTSARSWRTTGIVIAICIVVVIFVGIPRNGSVSKREISQKQAAPSSTAETINSNINHTPPQSTTVQKTPAGAQTTVSSERAQIILKQDSDSAAQFPPQGVSRHGGAGDKIFAIQVCTYRSVSDAQNLVERLQVLKLPVYYQGFPSEDGTTTPKFYIVLLGKYTTYNEAQNKLTEFKSLPTAKEFSDAYIRRL